MAVASPPVLGEWATVDSLKLPSGDWNAVLIKNSFFTEEAKAILSLPRLTWMTASSGILINLAFFRSRVAIGWLDSGSTLARPSERWQSPQAGVFKINTDAATRVRDGTSGIGVVIRDSHGHVRASLCQNLNANFQPQVAEALAILKGIDLAFENGFLPAVLESDALTVVNAISLKALLSRTFLLLSMLTSVDVFSVSFVPRLANKVAHCLAKLALDYTGEFVLLDDCPLSVESLVLGDYPMICSFLF
ncbi:hypothetical protein Dsin_007352 [Dipteronia sinensis]|uniref:RNase H type-1 domain-containing protein n=1 Tax=Dipteronia sinensis TaxID=43782 RepID=A0AAE0B1C4_9ROSI|nr:hypothetical protein Dsin_007352 [Dipteronia sinensis]